jgi:hypothetical protein
MIVFLFSPVLFLLSLSLQDVTSTIQFNAACVIVGFSFIVFALYEPPVDLASAYT